MNPVIAFYKIILIFLILPSRAADAFRQSAMVFTEHTGLSNLSVMMRYCVNETKCRRALIARSFEEKWTQKTVQEAVMCVLSSVAAEGVESHSHLQQSMK